MYYDGFRMRDEHGIDLISPEDSVLTQLNFGDLNEDDRTTELRLIQLELPQARRFVFVVKPLLRCICGKPWHPQAVLARYNSALRLAISSRTNAYIWSGFLLVLTYLLFVPINSSLFYFSVMFSDDVFRLCLSSFWRQFQSSSKYTFRFQL